MKQPVIWHGYAIVNGHGNVIAETFRTNRRDAWNKICPPNQRQRFKREGFRCARFWAREAEEEKS